VSQTSTGTTGSAGFFVRRVSGTGAVRLTTNGFTSTTTLTLTSNWQRFEASAAGSPTVGLQIDTSGDVIEVDFAQAEEGARLGTPIDTADNPVTIPPDNVTYTMLAANRPALSAGTWSVALRLLRRARSSDESRVARLQPASSADYSELFISTTGQLQARYSLAGVPSTTGTVTGPIVLDTDVQMACSYSAGVHRFATSQGADATTYATGTATTAPDRLLLTPSVGQIMVLERVTFFPAASTSGELADLALYGGTLPTPAVDTGWLDAWPASWVSATTAEQRAGARGVAEYLPGGALSHVCWAIDLEDSGNTAGVVQLGHVYMGGRWQPSINYSYGGSLGYRKRSRIVEAYSGAESRNRRPNPRELRVSLEWLTRAEALDVVLEIDRTLGDTELMLVSMEPDEVVRQPALTFPARIESLSTPAQVLPGEVWSCSAVFKELL
jgi:hypothetical protein